MQNRNGSATEHPPTGPLPNESPHPQASPPKSNSPNFAPSKRKENSSQGHGQCLEVLLRYRAVVNLSELQSWNFDQVPFRSKAGPFESTGQLPPPQKHRHPKAPAGRTTAKKITCLASAPSERQRYRLGVTNPRPIAVLAEPFVSSALSVLMKVSATTTKICTRGCSTGLHSHRFCAHPTHLSGSRPRNQVPSPLWGGCNKKTSSPSYSTPTFLKLYWGVG